VLKKYLGMTESMGPPRPKWKPGDTHKFFIRCFRRVTRRQPPRPVWNRPTKPLIRFRFVTFREGSILQCSKTRQNFIIKISLANFSSHGSLTVRA
jgi:hypothetical protein